MNRLFAANFRIALIVTAIGFIVLLSIAADSPAAAEEASEILYATESGIVAFVAMGITILLWPDYYRGNGGHLPAFVVGWILLVPALGSSIANSINGDYYGGELNVFLWYIGVSHILYGLTNARELVSGLTDDL